MLDWDHARPLTQVPSLNDAGGAAVLWADRRRFSILWEPYDHVLARALDSRGDQKRLARYRALVDRARAEGTPVIPCYEARCKDLTTRQVATLVDRKQLSWDRFTYLVPTVTGFSSTEVIPRDNSHHMYRLYRALQRELTPEQWRQIRPGLPDDVEQAAGKHKRAVVYGCAFMLVLGGCAIALAALLVRGLIGTL